MSLWIENSGASTAQIKAGIGAALEQFNGQNPSLIWQMLEDDDESARAIWTAAETAAFRITFKDWQEWPSTASLVWEG